MHQEDKDLIDSFVKQFKQLDNREVFIWLFTTVFRGQHMMNILKQELNAQKLPFIPVRVGLEVENLAGGRIIFSTYEREAQGLLRGYNCVGGNVPKHYLIMRA